MNSERLQKFNKEDLIKFYLRKDYDLEFYKKKFANQEKVGQLFIEGKKYNVYFEKEN